MKTFINKKTIGILMAALLITNLTLYHYFLAVSISWAAESVVVEEQFDEEDEEDGEEEQEEEVDESEDEEEVVEEEKEEPKEESEEKSGEESEESEEEDEVVSDENDEEVNEEELGENNISISEDSQVEENILEEEESISQANLEEQENEDQNEEEQSNVVNVGEVENEESTENLNINITEESENITESVSDTGENVIVNPSDENVCDEEESDDLTVEEVTEEDELVQKEDLVQENQEIEDSQDCIQKEDTENGEEFQGNEGDELVVEEEENLLSDEINEEGLIEEAEILTGDAEAQAVSINEINTNITTENGEKEVINVEDGSDEDVNLLNVFEKVLNGEKDENEEEGSEEKMDIKNINVATEVKNTVVALAETGENIIEDVEEFANIETGDAEAVAAVINMINTNIVGDNWYLAVVNILGSWTGDLIVPGEGLLTASDLGMKIENVININEASDIENSVIALAETGKNSIDGARGDSIIKTGDASSSASSFNMINTNIVSNNWFFLIINDAGNWVGQVINWGENQETQLVYQYDLGSSYVNLDGTAVDVYNYNSATNVTNSVQSIASTGENEINNAGDSSITTGNASAWASVFNFINTNIVGNNWFFGIVNNIGDWSGDLVFAYPDLEVSLEADKSEIEPGENLVYEVSYRNSGEADCDDVDLMLGLPDYSNLQSDAGGSFDSGQNNLSFSLPGLEAGEEKSLKVVINLMENVPEEISGIVSVAGVRTNTKEADVSDNYDSVETLVDFPVIENNTFVENYYYDYDYDEDEYSLEVERRENEKVLIGEIVTYSILVENTGEHSVYNIEIKEKIRDPIEDVIAEYYWNIAELEEDQTALIEYQVIFDEFAFLGNYNHRASALGFTEYGDEIKSDKVYSDVEVAFPFFSQSEEFIEESTPIITEASEDSQLPSLVLGVDWGGNGFDLNWSWFPLVLLSLYSIKSNKLHQPRQWQKLSRRISGFF